ETTLTLISSPEPQATSSRLSSPRLIIPAQPRQSGAVRLADLHKVHTGAPQVQEEEELQRHPNSNIKLLLERVWCLSLSDRLT
ncbi:hypothetical protein KXW10_006102, partial [Aspergillus fumigatus]